MLSKFLIIALAASPLVAGHGKVAVVTGDAGGNTTALGIQGGVVPGAGKNSQTEVDTTVFNQLNAASDGLGKTSGGGKNTLSGMTDVVSQSGSTLPQVSSGGSLSGTMHIVTTDGAGPYTAIVDPTGTGAFSSGTEADVTTQVPGVFGEISPSGQVPGALRRALVKMGLMKRAQNVNKDYPFSVAIPAGTTCTGTVGGMSGVCLVKMANPNPAGPFGGVFAMQMASGNTTTDAAKPAAGSATSTESTSTDQEATTAKAAKKPFAFGAKFRA